MDLVAFREGVSIRDGALLIQDWFNLNTGNQIQNRSKPPLTNQPAQTEAETKPASKKKQGKEAQRKLPCVEDKPNKKTAKLTADNQLFGTNQSLKFELKSLDPAHTNIQDKGFSEEIARHFQAGYFTGKRGVMKDKIAIPIHNADGDLVGYAGVSLKKLTYKFAKGFRSDFEIYNLHRAKQCPDFATTLYVVKHCFDVWQLYQAGIQNAVAIMSDSPSLQQIQTLEKELQPKTQLIYITDKKPVELHNILDLTTKFFVRIEKRVMLESLK